MYKLRFAKSGFRAAMIGAALMTTTSMVSAEETIKVGILHSLSGTMAISETTLKDVMLMLIEEQNKKGGILGKKLEAVVVDPASDWPLFAEKARELIEKERSTAVFGCWTSVRASRFCRSSKSSTACCSIRFSTRARKAPRMSSTPVLPPTSRPFRRSTT
jgi:ABC-type branched-subunit amino acid transport system substrate-binding protein